MKILAIDVHYRANIAKVVGVVFDTIDDDEFDHYSLFVEEVKAYEPGMFYKRELPCIMAILKQIPDDLYESILIDGYVYTSNNGDYGLGGHLYNSLTKKLPVIGVAKSFFKETHNVCKKVFRAESKNPLFVSSIGMNNDDAAQIVQDLNGPYRFPTVLSLLDQLTKSEEI